MFLKNLLFK